MDKRKLFINGQWIEPSTDDYIDVENPATRKIIAKVPAGKDADVDKAVEAAKNAFPAWRDKTPEERKAYLYKMAEYFENHVEEMGKTCTDELGMPVSLVADWQVGGAAEEARYYADLAVNYEYEKAFEGGIIRREPVGVIAQLSPWNFPLGQITVKTLPALAAGNCVVVKPSQVAPLCAYYIALAAEYADLPAGVFNLVTGRGGEVGNRMSSHPDIQMVSFTGSTVGGKEVGVAGIDSNVKKLTLELGGKSPAIVLESADYDVACDDVMENCFYNSGQICSALTRMIVPRKDKETIERMMVERAKSLKVGDPTDPEVMVGPLVSGKQFDKVKEYLEIGIKEGARMIYGEVPENADNGYFVKPAIFTDVNNQMKIAQDEIFGPVLCIIPYDTVEEAIAIANDSPYGLSGGAYGEREEVLNVARKMETGDIHINGNGFITPSPFGGYKQSGIGRENGPFGFEEYLEIKSMLIDM